MFPIDPTNLEEANLEKANLAIAKLVDRKQVWINLDTEKRINYLRCCVECVIAVAEDWVNAACIAKGIDPASDLAGEEWLAGTIATLLNLNLLIKSLHANGQPSSVASYTRSSGQIIRQVFPDNWMDRLLWLGFKGEIWLEPGKPATQGKIYRPPSATHPSNGQVGDQTRGQVGGQAGSQVEGRIALVLGAGNVSSIAPMDTLHKLFAEDQVVLLKMNPVNEYMGAILQQALQPLIADGFVQIVYGGAKLGSYLCRHPRVETIHITGSGQTHDAIVWGNPAEQPRRKASAHPQLDKPITSELGCVTPILIVPGYWSTSALKFQARQVAAMVVNNASFNCVAGQVLVTAKGWQQRAEFLSQVKQELAKIPPRKAYYPGTKERYQGFLDRYSQAEAVSGGEVPWTVIWDVPAQAGEYALETEAFCGILAEVSLGETEADRFLATAVEFANAKIWGNLSCVVLIDQVTQKRSEAALEQAIADLRYGAIGVNVWTGTLYFLSALTWGAFPGNRLEDIRSGQGIVHNAYLFDHPQKSVLRSPFQIRPTPSWFADHKNLLPLAKEFAKFQARSTWDRFLRVVWEALKG